MHEVEAHLGTPAAELERTPYQKDKEAVCSAREKHHFTVIIGQEVKSEQSGNTVMSPRVRKFMGLP